MIAETCGFHNVNPGMAAIRATQGSRHDVCFCAFLPGCLQIHPRPYFKVPDSTRLMRGL